jgi:hypothetical protein
MYVPRAPDIVLLLSLSNSLQQFSARNLGGKTLQRLQKPFGTNACFLCLMCGCTEHIESNPPPPSTTLDKTALLCSTCFFYYVIVTQGYIPPFILIFLGSTLDRFHTSPSASQGQLRTDSALQSKLLTGQIPHFTLRFLGSTAL